MKTDFLRISRPRPRTGRGLFARKAFWKGDFIVEYTGDLIPTRYADTLKTKYLFEVNEKWTVDGSPRSNIARYINHSCNPNCETGIVRGRILILAKRDIAMGEELTFDYGDEYFAEFIRPHGCRCRRCSGITD